MDRGEPSPTNRGQRARHGRGHLDEAAWLRARELQRLLFDAGFAGICYPREYGGQGLTAAHQKAFTEETAGYEMPLLLNIPTFSICGPVLLELGPEELRREHLPKVLRGEEVLVQFLFRAARRL